MKNKDIIKSISVLVDVVNTQKDLMNPNEVLIKLSIDKMVGFLNKLDSDKAMKRVLKTIQDRNK